MNQLTRSKVAYDLSISPHRFSVTYGDSSIEFVFSSDLYKRKFMEKQHENRKTISNSLTKRFGVRVQCSILPDLKLYTTIEKRGFLLFKDGVEVKCQDGIILDGERVTLQSLGD